MTHPIEIRTEAGICRIRLMRPEKKNALTDAMYQTLVGALDTARTDPLVRAVVITAEGPDFCAGNDIGDFAQVAMRAATAGPDDAEPMAVMAFLKALAYFPKPLLAGVQGQAVGIGTTLLLHCDLVVLADSARLSVPFVNLALVPEAASSVLLTERIGHARAWAMFALGEALSAQDALTLGLANRVVREAEVEGAVLALAEALCDKAAGALAQTKALMRDPERIWAVMQAEGRIFQDRLRSPEAAEAFSAFMARRKPDFRQFNPG